MTGHYCNGCLVHSQTGYSERQSPTKRTSHVSIFGMRPWALMTAFLQINCQPAHWCPNLTTLASYTITRRRTDYVQNRNRTQQGRCFLLSDVEGGVEWALDGGTDKRQQKRWRGDGWALASYHAGRLLLVIGTTTSTRKSSEST